MPRPSRLLADIRPLRECPPYRRLWAGSLVSSIGAAMTAFAMTLQAAFTRYRRVEPAPVAEEAPAQATA